MIKISYFDLFANFMRLTYQFDEEKAYVRMKSLKTEREFEFEYRDVGELSNRFYANSHQGNFGFWSLFAISLVLAAFCRPIYANPVLLRIAQVLYICSLFLYITGFRKSWWLYILDRNDRLVAYLKRSRQNIDLISKVIEAIKNKSESAPEFSAATPFPEENAVFEHVYYDLPEWIKTTDRFYGSEIIGFEKGPYREVVYNIKYSQLNGKVYRGKATSDVLAFSLSISLPAVSTIVGFMYSFGLELGLTFTQYLWYFLGTLLVLSLVSWPFGFLKREVLGLHGKDGSIAYWTYVNKANKDKIEEIIRFIQSKISAVTNEELLKEHA